MTVVNMLSFGDSGATIADEQASSYIRKSNIANKLRLIGSHVFGGSGNMIFINGVYECLTRTLPSDCNFDQLGRYLPEITISLGNTYKNNYFSANFNLSLDELMVGTKGKNPLDNEVKRICMDTLNHLNRDLSENNILIGGLENNKFGIFYFSFGNCSLSRSPLPYASIGSGSDEAGRILSQYIEQKSKKEREKIDPVEGFLKLIEATNQASMANIGVGGIPSIVYVNKTGLKEVEEEKCILLSEIVKGYDYKQLPRCFVHQAINDLIFGEAKFEEVEKQMKQKAKCWNKFERLLRGYKN